MRLTNEQIASIKIYMKNTAHINKKWSYVLWEKLPVKYKFSYSLNDLGLGNNELDFNQSAREIVYLAKESGVNVDYERKPDINTNSEIMEFTIKSRLYAPLPMTEEESKIYGVKITGAKNKGLTSRIKPLDIGEHIKANPNQRGAAYTLARKLGYKVKCEKLSESSMKVTRIE